MDYNLHHLIKQLTLIIADNDFSRLSKLVKSNKKLLKSYLSSSKFPYISLCIYHSTTNIIPICKTLLNLGADVNLFNPVDKICDTPPLILAIEFKEFDLCKLLIEYGANINSYSDYPRIPIIGSVILDRLDICQLLIDNGADIDAYTPTQSAAILVAVNDLNIPMCKLLIENGANINFVDSHNTSPLGLSLFKGKTHNEISKLLINNGSDVNLITPSGANMLTTAVENNNLEMCKILIEHGADINGTCHFNPLETSLCMYAYDAINRNEITKLLIENGAYISIERLVYKLNHILDCTVSVTHTGLEMIVDKISNFIDLFTIEQIIYNYVKCGGTYKYEDMLICTNKFPHPEIKNLFYRKCICGNIIKEKEKCKKCT